MATCKQRNIGPTIARWVYWDRKQKYPDSRYWTHVFETHDYHQILGTTR